LITYPDFQRLELDVGCGRIQDKKNPGRFLGRDSLVLGGCTPLVIFLLSPQLTQHPIGAGSLEGAALRRHRPPVFQSRD
jgi:hypothetical protein